MPSIPVPGPSNRPARISHSFNLPPSSFKKSTKKALLKEAEAAEPYEVAPGTGILNTDATAIVFGYIDREEQKKADQKKRDKKSKRVDSQQRNRSRSRSPIKKAYNKYREVHTDDGKDDHSKRTHRQHVVSGIDALQKKRDESYNIWKESQERSKRGRMVSEEDKLQSRGANPRTGIVTPYVVSDHGSVDSGYGTDYMRVHQGPIANQGSWRQDEKGWSLVEDLDPLVLRHKASAEVKRIVFRDLANPVGDIAAQQLPDDHPILQGQQAAIRVDREKNNQTTRRDTKSRIAPSGTPDGLSSSPRVGLRSISRKKVGSGNSHREGSEDTVIINGRIRATSVPQPQRCQRERPRVRIITPTHTGHRLAATTSRSHSHVHTTRSFLGLRPSPSPNPPSSLWAAPARRGPRHAQEPLAQVSGTYPNQLTTSRQNQNIPRRQENAQNHISVVEPDEVPIHTSQRSHPGQLPMNEHKVDPLINDPALEYHHPDSLWRVHNQMRSHPRAIADVPITTTTITMMPPTVPATSRWAKRPRPFRVDGSKSVPQLKIRTKDRLNSYLKDLPESATIDGVTTIITAHDKPYTTPQGEGHHRQHDNVDCTNLQSRSPSETSVTAAGAMPGRFFLPNTQIAPAFQGEAYNGWVVPDDAVVPVPRHTVPYHASHDSRACTWTRGTNPTVATDAGTCDQRSMTVGSGNFCRTTEVQGHDWSRTGHILIDGDLDIDESQDLRYRACENEHRQKYKVKAAQGMGPDRPDATLAKRTIAMQGSSPARESIMSDIMRSNSLKRRVVEVQAVYSSVHLKLSPYSPAKVVVRTLIIMVHRVLVTLSPSSRALAVLGELEPLEAGEYWAAVREVLQAVTYLLILMGVILVAGKVFRTLIKIKDVLLIPVSVGWRVGMWCFVG